MPFPTPPHMSGLFFLSWSIQISFHAWFSCIIPMLHTPLLPERDEFTGNEATASYWCLSVKEPLAEFSGENNLHMLKGHHCYSADVSASQIIFLPKRWLCSILARVHMLSICTIPPVCILYVES